MVSKTFISMGFSLCGLLFITLILMMYLSKRRENKHKESKVFFVLLIFTIILLIIEISYIYSMSFLPSDIVNLTLKETPITALLCRGYLLSTLLWMIGLGYYVLLVGTKRVSPIERKNKIRRQIVYILGFVFVVTSIVTCLLPITNSVYINDIYAFGGDALTVTYIVGFLVSLIILIVLFVRNLYFPKEQKLPVYFTFIVMLILVLFQLLSGYDYNVITFVFSLIMATLYFTIENQDYKLMGELEQSKSEAEVADLAKTNFLTSMSHEIRTPMNTILGFSESLLMEQELSEEVLKRDTKNIKEAGLTLLDLINNILDISRIESNKETITNKEYDLQTLVFEINSFITSKINSNEITYELIVDPNLPRRFNGDYVKICKSIENILVNALNYTNYGKITLDIHEKLPREGKIKLEFIISNTGHAMQQEDFNVKFSDFVKLDSNIDNRVDSVLLGLIVAKRLVGMMNGEIDFKNETGKGTRYFVTLEQEIATDELVGDIFQNKSKDVPVLRELILSDKKLLIVDDNKVNIKLAVRLLEGYKAQIDTALSGKECIELVKNNEYDLIFLDHMMPEMDGLATLKALKESGYKVPKVIALTANSYAGIREKYLDMGFDDYLAKPINYKDLNKLMHKFFEED